MKWIIVAMFLVADVGAYFSVPKAVRHENMWALFPGCGFALFTAYHFGDKIKTPNVQVQRDSGSIIAGGSAGMSCCTSAIDKRRLCAYTVFVLGVDDGYFSC